MKPLLVLRFLALLVALIVTSKSFAQTTSNPKQSIAELQAAAQAGDVWAQVHLGDAYKSGTRGVPLDLNLAAKFYKMAVDQGNPTAMACLARVYLKISGLPDAQENAFRLLLTSAELDSKMGVSFLTNSLQQGYEFKEIKLTPEECAALLTKVAIQGSDKDRQYVAKLKQEVKDAPAPTPAPTVASISRPSAPTAPADAASPTDIPYDANVVSLLKQAKDLLSRVALSHQGRPFLAITSIQDALECYGVHTPTLGVTLESQSTSPAYLSQALERLTDADSRVPSNSSVHNYISKAIRVINEAQKLQGRG